jgi:hypothetical protein
MIVLTLYSLGDMVKLNNSSAVWRVRGLAVVVTDVNPQPHIEYDLERTEATQHLTTNVVQSDILSTVNR